MLGRWCCISLSSTALSVFLKLWWSRSAASARRPVRLAHSRHAGRPGLPQARVVTLPVTTPGVKKRSVAAATGQASERRHAVLAVGCAVMISVIHPVQRQLCAESAAARHPRSPAQPRAARAATGSHVQPRAARAATLGQIPTLNGDFDPHHRPASGATPPLNMKKVGGVPGAAPHGAAGCHPRLRVGISPIGRPLSGSDPDPQRQAGERRPGGTRKSPPPSRGRAPRTCVVRTCVVLACGCWWD